MIATAVYGMLAYLLGQHWPLYDCPTKLLATGLILAIVMRGFFQHFMALSFGTFRVQVDAILAQGDLIVVLCTESAQRGSRSWTSPQVHV